MKLFHLRRAIAAVAALALTGFALVGGAGAAAAAAPPPSDTSWTWDASGWGWQASTSVVAGRTLVNGYWYRSPHGTYLVENQYNGVSRGSLATEHARTGGGRGALGYPVSSRVGRAGQLDGYQLFERGVIYQNNYDKYTVQGGPSPFDATHRATGGGSGYLGFPTGNEVREAGSHFYQPFEGGLIYASPSGAYAVAGKLRTSHSLHGGGRGIGYPTGREVGQGAGYKYQVFERGVVYCANVGSGERCSAVKGGFSDIHARYGGGGGQLGYPTRDETYNRSGATWTQRFERGTVEVDPKSGQHWVTWERNSF